jgi:hypothetical protein
MRQLWPKAMSLAGCTSRTLTWLWPAEQHGASTSLATHATTLAKSDEFGQPHFLYTHPASGQEIKQALAKLVTWMAKRHVPGCRFEESGLSGPVP